ncbi:MAG: hypothetical protein WC752_00685 [Patescibacteria group bacterium]
MPWWVILLISLFFCGVLVSQSFLASSDILYYNFHARIFTHYHQNPYIASPENYTGDSFCAFVCEGIWSNLTNNYGPLWFYMTLIPSYLANNNYFLNIILMRLLAVFFFLGGSLLLYKILKTLNPVQAKTGFYLIIFNPLFIFETAVNGHNDAALLFFVIAAIYFVMQKKYTLTYLALLISFLIKFVTLPIIAAYLIFLFCLKKKKKYLIFLILLGLTLVATAYAPIWQGWATLNGLITQNGMIHVYSNSPIFYFIRLLGQSFFNFPAEITKYLVIGLYGLVYLFLIKKYFLTDKISSNNFFQAGFNIIFFLIFIPLTWIMPWYFLWILPWAVINGQFKWLMAFTIIGIVSYVAPIWLSFTLFFIVSIPLLMKNDRKILINQHFFFNSKAGNQRKN